MKQVQDAVERLWDFIDKLDINTFGKFLADNIVGSVVVFSLVFWIPLSILVHCVDKRLDQQYEENTKSLFHPSNVEMLSSLESAPIRIFKAPLPPPAEDASSDSHLDEDVLEEDFSPGGSGAKSFEDLTEQGGHAPRSDKAQAFRLQRQARISSKETEC
ncbi:hypothetical protein AAFF_G00222790 [Aldrovandia affinis]|uniref:Uncharacterized protein n=1 Tax=Aldrovandia affinis TaxID=143900 RepID=A0AAD7RFC9_9TELE|nr:hypothetical protein AAFF_G00222790 [Aldrovandia affinis]